MTKKKLPATIEECQTEIEQTEKQLRQYENRNKMLDRKLAAQKRRERSHRLCSRGGYLESIVPELIRLTAPYSEERRRAASEAAKQSSLFKNNRHDNR